VSSTACDRCPYVDHAAVNVMQQGVQRRPVAPKGRRPGNCAHRRIDCRRVDSPYELDNAPPGGGPRCRVRRVCVRTPNARCGFLDSRFGRRRRDRNARKLRGPESSGARAAHGRVPGKASPNRPALGLPNGSSSVSSQVVAQVVADFASKSAKCWSEWQDLNLRPPRPERGALPDHATLRLANRPPSSRDGSWRPQCTRAGPSCAMPGRRSILKLELSY
jgi:hypothetical protein